MDAFALFYVDLIAGFLEKMCIMAHHTTQSCHHMFRVGRLVALLWLWRLELLIFPLV